MYDLCILKCVVCLVLHAVKQPDDNNSKRINQFQEKTVGFHTKVIQFSTSWPYTSLRQEKSYSRLHGNNGRLLT